MPVTKTILITGASDGLGKETAFCMAELGFNLVLVGRNRAKLEQVAAEIGKVHQVQISLYVADLSSVKAVLELANDLNENLDRIDVLLNNAGAFFNSYQSNSEGIEQTFALNHLSYFQLANQLLPLVEKAGGRIVNVASRAHQGVDLDLVDIEGKVAYNGWRAYQKSKLCNILFTRELGRRLEESGSGVTVCALHPGFVDSAFGDNSGGFLGVVLRVLKKAIAINIQKGAQTQVYLCTTEQPVQQGGYYANKKLVLPSSAARDMTTATQLWHLSEDYIRRALST